MAIVKLNDNVCDLTWATQRIPDVYVAVREVIMNAIDAQAKTIVIGIGDDGLSFTVDDDGYGIPSHDLYLLVGQTAGIKLNKLKEIVINDLATSKKNCRGRAYGSRGDALLCLSIVASVRIESCHYLKNIRYRKVFEKNRVVFNGRIQSSKCAHGTHVAIDNLFGNVPVRQRQIRPLRARVLAFVQSLLRKYTIVHDSITFKLVDSNVQVRLLRYPAYSTPMDLFTRVCGSISFSQPQKISWCNGTTTINGFLAFFNFESTSNTRGNYLAQVKRVAQSFSSISFRSHWFNSFELECQSYIAVHLSKAPMQCNQLWPILIIDVVILEHEYDIVDSCIILRNAEMLRDDFNTFLHRILPITASKSPPTPNIAESAMTQLNNEFVDAIWTRTVDVHQQLNKPSTRERIKPIFSSMKTQSSQQSRYFRTTQKPQARKRRKLSAKHLSQNLGVFVQTTKTSRKLSLQLSKSTLCNVNVLGQVDRKFILFSTKTSPMLVCAIDQHAADERVRLEELEDKYLTQSMFPRAELVEPEDLQLNPMEEAVVKDEHGTLAQWGFEINATTMTLYTAPFVECRQAQIDDCLEYITLLCESRTVRPPVITRLLHSRACRSAIMFGDSLSHRACELLLQQLSKCRLPFQCAHGRPSIAPLVQLN
ncbi:DNA mismatch repair enzyme [Thraustotheca clavata]|uniref:DNA mismatch repair enzyme n=1 Tax=Thraustotheca clavata TaxID=74557 RepID=A0A1W0A4G1_9STRA|nr:DNA mismatch repair enzyme [Thraustotheca clavata]